MSKIESRLAGTRLPFGLPTYTLATRPSLAARDAGRLIYVTNAPAGWKIQVWNGAAWETVGGAQLRTHRVTWAGQNTVSLPWIPRGDIAVFVVARAEFLVQGTDYTLATDAITLLAAGQAKLNNGDVLVVVGVESGA
ncbi:MAG: hypothetical protein N2047_08560 [Meiothermus sp.]|nr:hypothetical protein [Meiothermus sp.]